MAFYELRDMLFIQIVNNFYKKCYELYKYKSVGYTSKVIKAQVLEKSTKMSKFSYVYYSSRVQAYHGIWLVTWKLGFEHTPTPVWPQKGQT